MRPPSAIRLSWKDTAEIAIGATTLGFPIAVTEEVWNLSAELSMARILFLMLGSMVFIAFFVYAIYYHQQLGGNRLEFFKRVCAVYAVTLVCTSLILWGVDRFPLLSDPLIAMKRTVLVAVAASLSATIVDSLH